MGKKRVLRVRNALTGAVREVVLPSAPASENAPMAVPKLAEGGLVRNAEGEDDGADID